MKQTLSTLSTLLLATLVCVPVTAEEYFLTVDVPAYLGGADYTPNQIVHGDSAVYALTATLPEEVHLAAVHLRPDGKWLFAPAHPVNLGGTDFEPRDIVTFDGAIYTSHLDGSAIGIPDGVRIDALFLDPGGASVISFDVPVELGGSLFGRSDLVRHDEDGFSLHWDGAGAGVPPYANLVGAARDRRDMLILTFDVPVNLGGSEYLPGTLVHHGPLGFSQRFEDPSWPPYAQLRDFSYPAFAGATPDGNTYPGDMLELGKATGDEIQLRWGASCNSGDSDYAIYEGQIGSFGIHDAKLCSTGGNTSATLTPNTRDVYYLVVPQNALYEGSYGVDSTGFTRPPYAGSACLPQQIGSCQ